MTSTLEQLASVTTTSIGSAAPSIFSNKARYFSTSNLLASTGLKTFSDAASVATFFGTTSPEAAVASLHFGIQNKRGGVNSSIAFDYYSLAPKTTATITTGGYQSTDFNAITALNGSLTITFTGKSSKTIRSFSANFDGSAVTSLDSLIATFVSWLASAGLTGATATAGSGASSNSIIFSIPLSALGSGFLNSESISMEWSSGQVLTPPVLDRLKLTTATGAVSVPIDGRTPAQYLSDSWDVSSDMFGVAFVSGVNGGLSQSQLTDWVSVFGSKGKINNLVYSFATTILTGLADVTSFGQSVGVLPVFVTSGNDLAPIFQVAQLQTWQTDSSIQTVFDFDMLPAPASIKPSIKNDAEYDQYSNPLTSPIAANAFQSWEVLGTNYRSGNMWGPPTNKMNVMEFMGNKFLNNGIQIGFAYLKTSRPVVTSSDVSQIIDKVFQNGIQLGVVVKNRVIAKSDIPAIIATYGNSAIDNLVGGGYVYKINEPTPAGSGFSTLTGSAIYGGLNTILRLNFADQIYV